MSERIYSCSDADMLLASDVVMGNFNVYKDKLTEQRSKWNDPFGPDLEVKIDNGLDILGIDTKLSQTAKTRDLVSLQTRTLSTLTTFKIQLEVDLEDKPEKLEEILRTLGFNKYYQKAHVERQASVVKLLTAFKKNMTPELRQEIVDSGTNEEIIDGLIAARDPLHELNVQQEKLKNRAPRDTAVNVDELNAIYKLVIGICKIAPRLLPDVPSAADDFSFRKILGQLH